MIVFQKDSHMLINLDNIYSYNSILTKSTTLSKLYPKLIKVIHIGTSNDNRIISMLKVGKGEKGPVFIAGVHGRESVNPTVMLAVIERYASKYYGNGEKLLDKYSLYFIPILNPDGYVIANEGFFSINNPRLRKKCRSINISHEEYKYNAEGIDISRNFASKSFVFNNNSGLPNDEPETAAFIHTCEKYEFMGLIDFHSRGNAIFYYRNALDYEYNKRQFDIACRLSKITSYSLYTPSQENTDNISGGNTVNYFSEEFHLPAITIETVEDEAVFSLEQTYCNEVYKEIKNVPLEFLKLLVSS